MGICVAKPQVVFPDPSALWAQYQARRMSARQVVALVKSAGWYQDVAQGLGLAPPVLGLVSVFLADKQVPLTDSQQDMFLAAHMRNDVEYLEALQTPFAAWAHALTPATRSTYCGMCMASGNVPLVVHCFKTCLQWLELRTALFDFWAREPRTWELAHSYVYAMVLEASVAFAGTHGHHWLWAAQGCMRTGACAPQSLCSPSMYASIAEWASHANPTTLEHFPPCAMDVVLDMAMWHTSVLTGTFWSHEDIVQCFLAVFSLVRRLHITKFPCFLRPPSVECVRRYAACLERLLDGEDWRHRQFIMAGNDFTAQSAVVLGSHFLSLPALRKWKQHLPHTCRRALDMHEVHLSRWSVNRAAWVAGVVKCVQSG